MLHALRTARTNITTPYLAAALVAMLMGVGAAAAQAVNPSLTFKNGASVKISVKVDKIGYREDIDPGSSVAVPSSKLQNVDPTDAGIVWDAYQADLNNIEQQKPNPRCDGGLIRFDNSGAATIEVRGSC